MINFLLFQDFSESNALALFHKDKVGNFSHERKFKAQLEATMETLYNNWSKLNSSCHLLLSAQKKNFEATKAETNSIASLLEASNKLITDLRSEVETERARADEAEKKLKMILEL
jgi:hypothetical protein